MAPVPEPTPPGRGLAAIAALPKRIVLSIVSAGVMASLTVAGASVWLASIFGPSRRK